MGKVREYNYELLRIISCIAVIMIHVSGIYIGAVDNNELFGNYYLNGIMTTCVYNSISRFAVPIFVMMSGAFCLANEKNKDYKCFYRKQFSNIGVPTLIFSVMYFIYFMLQAGLGVVVKGKEVTNLIEPIKNFVKGAPAAHMWYLYMMLGVYLLTPFIISFKTAVGEKSFCRVALIFLLLASISVSTSTHEFYWDLGYSFCFAGYFMTGYVLRKIICRNKNNIRGSLFILIGIAILVFMSFLLYCQTTGRIEGKYDMEEPYFPLIMIASVCIFTGFGFMTIERSYTGGEMNTFLIYLVHAGVWDIVCRIAIKLGLYKWNNAIAIPVLIIAVFVLSVVVSKIYEKIWEYVDSKWLITDRLCGLMKL